MSYQGYSPYDLEAQIPPNEEEYPTFQDDLPTTTPSTVVPKLRTTMGVSIEDDLYPLVKTHEFTKLMQIHVSVATVVSALAFVSV